MKNLLKFCLEAYLFILEGFIGALLLIFSIACAMLLVFAPIWIAVDLHIGWSALLLYLVTLPIFYYFVKKLDEPYSSRQKKAAFEANENVKKYSKHS